MKRNRKFGVILFFVFIILFSNNSFATPKLKVGTGIVNVGYTLKCKVTGTKKKVKWSTNNKKIAVISSKGVLKGKKDGFVSVIAKVGKKTLRKNVRVQQIYYTGNVNESVYNKYYKNAGEAIYSAIFKPGKFTIKGSVTVWNTVYELRTKKTFPNNKHTYKLSSDAVYSIAGERVTQVEFKELLDTRNGLGLFLYVTENTIYSMGLSS